MADLNAAWFDGAETIGLTAGTSTPDGVIDEVQSWLEDFTRIHERLAQNPAQNAETELAPKRASAKAIA
jgi:4-hydroxy-3-methylbut-2-enyl diphosphate reductase IspH